MLSAPHALYRNGLRHGLQEGQRPHLSFQRTEGQRPWWKDHPGNRHEPDLLVISAASLSSLRYVEVLLLFISHARRRTKCIICDFKTLGNCLPKEPGVERSFGSLTNICRQTGKTNVSHRFRKSLRSGICRMRPLGHV